MLTGRGQRQMLCWQQDRSQGTGHCSVSCPLTASQAPPGCTPRPQTLQLTAVETQTAKLHVQLQPSVINQTHWKPFDSYHRNVLSSLEVHLLNHPHGKGACQGLIIHFAPCFSSQNLSFLPKCSHSTTFVFLSQILHFTVLRNI